MIVQRKICFLGAGDTGRRRLNRRERGKEGTRPEKISETP